MEDGPKIMPKENGALVVQGAAEFVLPDGTTAEPAEKRFLCRCGQSANKPYCDGSHRDAGFASAAEAVSSKDRVYNYAGAEITVHYNKLLCSHAGECGKRLKAVFDPGARPWVQPDNGSVDDIKAVVAACPSGALTYSDTGAPAHIVGKDARITVEPNGPYRVENVALAGEGYRAASASEDKFVLCRCGLSKNKPYCDGSHSDAGWRDS